MQGILSMKHRITIEARPITKEKLRKLCTYLAASAMRLNESWPIKGISTSFPKVMFNPVKASTTKEEAVNQCENRSNALKRCTFQPDRPDETRSRPMSK